MITARKSMRSLRMKACEGGSFFAAVERKLGQGDPLGHTCFTSAASLAEIGASISLNSSMLLAVLNRSSFSFDAGWPAARWFAGSCTNAARKRLARASGNPAIAAGDAARHLPLPVYKPRDVA